MNTTLVMKHWYTMQTKKKNPEIFVLALFGAFCWWVLTHLGQQTNKQMSKLFSPRSSYHWSCSCNWSCPCNSSHSLFRAWLGSIDKETAISDCQVIRCFSSAPNQTKRLTKDILSYQRVKGGDIEKLKSDLSSFSEDWTTSLSLLWPIQLHGSSWSTLVSTPRPAGDSNVAS